MHAICDGHLSLDLIALTVTAPYYAITFDLMLLPVSYV
jgi:hypothetical protein